MECNDWGYARNGCNKEAIKLFEQMEYLGIIPYDSTLDSIFFTYSHDVLVKGGYLYLTTMNDYYHITLKTLYMYG